MKSREKGLLIILALLVLVIGVYVFIINMETEASDEETEAASEELVISSSDSSQITRIAYERDDKKFSFIKENAQWLYEADRDFPVLQDKLTAMANQLGAVTAIRKLETPNDLSEYGLDAPLLKVSYTDSDGNQAEFIVGDSNDGAGGSYLQMTGDDAVYLVSTDFADAFISNLYEMADMEDMPAIAAADVTGVKIVSGDQELTIMTDGSASSGWTVSEDASEAEDCSSSAVTTLLNTITGSSFKSDVDYNCQDMSKYGLDAPKAAVTVDYTEKVTVEAETDDSDGGEEASETEGSDSDAEASETGDTDSQDDSQASEEADETEETETVTVQRQMILYIGQKDADGDYYVCLDGSGEIHTLAGETAEQIMGYRAVDLLAAGIITSSLSEVTSMDVAMDGRNWHIEKKTIEVPAESEADSGDAETETAEQTETESEMTTETKWYVGDKEIELTYLSSAYGNLSGMTAEKILENAVEPEGSTILTVILHLEDGFETTVIFTGYDSSFQLASVDGTARRLVNKRDVEKLMESLQTLLED